MSDVISSPPIYQTPSDTPTEYICRRLLIPNELDWLKLVNGALGTLGVTDFFTETAGGVSIDDTVAEMLEMIVNSKEGCPGEESAVQTAYVHYDLADGTNGMALTQYADNVVPLNSENDPDGIIVLASNVVVPIAGTWEIEAVCAIRDGGRPRLFWVTGGTRVVLGVNADNEDNHMHVKGIFTANGTQAFYLAAYTNASGAFLGRAVDTSALERYASVALRRLGEN